MAGLLTHTLRIAEAGLGNSSLQGAAVDGNAIPKYYAAIAASQTNLAVTLPTITIANLRSIFIVTDHALTLKTNSSGSPQETLSLTAGAPFVWQTGSGNTAPFAGNVTAWYATTGVSITTVTAYLLVN